jgi:dTDP-4-amino-4,6-dideoxygalactose transaminase
MPKVRNIPFIDLSLKKVDLDKTITNISRLIKDKNFIGGDEVKKFEENFSKFNESKYCLGVANGTDALEIALESLDIPKNSEVIVPNFTFLSPAEAVVRGGYKLVLADINLNDFTISLESLNKLITKNTSTLIVVHLFGNPCNMTEIKKITDKHGIKIIEDCSQAHGAKFRGKIVGNFGDIGTFSFYPTKNLGAFGDSGAIVTNKKSIFKKAQKIANHGRVATYDHLLAGRNSRLDSIQASVLNLKIKNLKKYNELRIKQASHLIKAIKTSNIETLKLTSDQFSVFHQFPILSTKRESLMTHLKKKGINCGIYYPKPLSKMKAFSNKVLRNKVHSKNSEMACNQILSLPIGPHLNIKDSEYIANAIQSFPK